MGAAWAALMKTGAPPWDAPPSFWLWLRATQANDFTLILQVPLSKDAWYAAKWLFQFPGFQQRYAKLTFDLLKVLLSQAG